MSNNYTLTKADVVLYKRAVERFENEFRAGKNTGNYGLTTSAGFRLAVSTFKADVVREYLLNEMGIKVPVDEDGQGLVLTFGKFNHHSHSTVLRDLQGAYRVMSLMHEDGRQVIKILGVLDVNKPPLSSTP